MIRSKLVKVSKLGLFCPVQWKKGENQWVRAHRHPLHRSFQPVRLHRMWSQIRQREVLTFKNGFTKERATQWQVGCLVRSFFHLDSLGYHLPWARPSHCMRPVPPSKKVQLEP